MAIAVSVDKRQKDVSIFVKVQPKRPFEEQTQIFMILASLEMLRFRLRKFIFDLDLHVISVNPKVLKKTVIQQ